MKLNQLSRALLLALAAAAAPHAVAADDSQAALRAAIEEATNAAAKAAREAPSYEQNLYDIMFGLPFYEGLAHAKLPPGTAALRDYYVRKVSKQDLTKRLVPGMQAIVSPVLASQVAASMRAPAYRKRMRIQVAAQTGSSPGSELLTVEDMAVLNRIDNAQSSKDFAALMPKISELVRTQMAASREELEMQLARQALAAIERTQAEIEKVSETGQPVPIRTIGFEPWDQIIRAIGDSTLGMALTFYRFNQQLEKMDYHQQLKAANLVQRHHYAEASALVDQAEDALATALKDLDQIIRQREADIGKSEFASQSKFRAKLDEATGSLYTFAGDVGESYRAMYAAQRQMIAFLQERKGAARMEGETIVFDDDASAAAMNEIFKRILTAAQQVQAIVDRQTARENAEMDKARNSLKKSG